MSTHIRDGETFEQYEARLQLMATVSAPHRTRLAWLWAKPQYLTYSIRQLVGYKPPTIH